MTSNELLMPSMTAGVSRGSSDSLAMFAAIPPDLVAPRSCGHLCH